MDEFSSIVLGCTHFNYFKDTFRQILPNYVKFVDGNEGTVNKLTQELEYLTDDGEDNQSVEYYYSGIKVTDRDELLRLNNCLERLDEMLLIE